MKKLRSVLKNKKGVAGLDLALSIIAMLFVIGLLVMIFTLMGAELQGVSSVEQELSVDAVDTSLSLALEVVNLTACDAANLGAISSVASVWNDTTLVNPGNYTFSGCTLSLVDGVFPYNETLANTTYTYTTTGTTWDIINDTSAALADTPDWFPIVIVITFMVVLILLTVMIIRAIRGSGLMVGGA